MKYQCIRLHLDLHYLSIIYLFTIHIINACVHIWRHTHDTHGTGKAMCSLHFKNKKDFGGKNRIEGGSHLSGLTSNIAVIKFWVALLLIIYVVRGSGMPFFGVWPEARANLLGKQPRCYWEKTEHQAVFRNTMHPKNSKSKLVNIIYDWPKLVLCSLPHLKFFLQLFFKSYCDAIVLLSCLNHVTSRIIKEKEGRKRLCDGRRGRERAALSEIAFIMWPWCELCHQCGM